MDKHNLIEYADIQSKLTLRDRKQQNYSKYGKIRFEKGAGSGKNGLISFVGGWLYMGAFLWSGRGELRGYY